MVRKYSAKQNGSGGRIRTCDQLVNSQLRYHCATPEQVVVNRPLGVVKSEVNVSKAPPVVNRARRYFLSGGSRRV